MVVLSHWSFLNLAVNVFGVGFPVGAAKIDLQRNAAGLLIRNLRG
jgi:hypothetical protein